MENRKRVPLFRCGVGACLHVDRDGERVLIYQSDRPETVIELTIEEYNAWVKSAKLVE